MNAHQQDGDIEVVDLSAQVAELQEDITGLCADSDLPPVACVCACLRVVFNHAENLAGLESLRELIAQHDVAWQEQHAESSNPLIHQPPKGALQ